MGKKGFEGMVLVSVGGLVLAVGVLVSWLGIQGAIALESSVVLQAVLLNLGFLITMFGLLPKAGLTARNRRNAFRQLGHGMFSTYGMLCALSALMGNASPQIGAVGIAMVMCSFVLMWWVLKDSASAQYDYSRHWLTDEESWWCWFTGSLALPCQIFTLLVVVFIAMGPALILHSMNLLPEPRDFSARARVLALMPVINFLMTGFFSAFDFKSLCDVALSEQRRRAVQ